MDWLKFVLGDNLLVDDIDRSKSPSKDKQIVDQ
jgi:hypothetical protein